MITIQKTVDIPADRRLHLDLDVPESVPSGRTRLVLSFPAQAAGEAEKSAGTASADKEPWIPLVSWLRKRREERFRQAVMGIAGKFNHVFDEDGVTLQRRWRDEWDTDD